MAPWYNPILNGYYIIQQILTADFLLVVKSTDSEFIAADANKLILMTLTSPINFIIVCIVLFGCFHCCAKSEKASYHKKIARLNTNTNELLNAFNLQVEPDNSSGLSNLSHSINSHKYSCVTYLKRTNPN
ncbi:hypothetical protein ACOBV8_19730 (plasmid) [Pseudoalteromonas espejiana]